MIGELVKKYRKQKGLTQAELSEALHIVQTHVSRIEKGLTTPSVELLVELVEYLKIPGGELLEALHIIPEPPREEKLETSLHRLFELVPELTPDQQCRVRDFLHDQLELARLRKTDEQK